LTGSRRPVSSSSVTSSLDVVSQRMLEEARGALARSEEEAKEQILRLRGQLERSEAGAASARQELQAVFVRLAADHKGRRKRHRRWRLWGRCARCCVHLF